MSEGKAIPFTLNGESVTAAPGETVLSVAKRHGIKIPTLCHHDSLTPQGACRLCVVEVWWGKRSKLVTSCIYQPWEGDVVVTDNERVRKVRAMVLRLLWSRNPGVEVLRDLAREHGVSEPGFSIDGASKENRCILCGLCVRVCAEVVGQHAIGFANRGVERVVSTPFGDQADECIGCGACVFICPTEALHYEDMDGRRVLKEFNTEVPLLKCRGCGETFATVKQMARVRERLKLPDELAELCPRCRGSQHRAAMEKVLLSNKQ
jgi:NADH dehydrogenase/NADH:ubiquinone oxidoreductase subunit G